MDKLIIRRKPVLTAAAALAGVVVICLAVVGLREVLSLARRAGDDGGHGGAGFALYPGEKLGKPLKIVNLKIDNAISPDGGGNISFRRSDKIIISYDAANLFAVRLKNKSPLIHIRQDLVLRDRRGNIVFIKPAILDVEKPLDKKPARFINEISLGAIKDLPTGEYEIGVLLTDLVGFQTVVGKLDVTVE